MIKRVAALIKILELQNRLGVRGNGAVWHIEGIRSGVEQCKAAESRGTRQ